MKATDQQLANTADAAVKLLNELRPRVENQLNLGIAALLVALVHVARKHGNLERAAFLRLCAEYYDDWIDPTTLADASQSQTN